MFNLFSRNRSDGEPIRLYNTKSRSVEEFTPLKRDTVLMYACGPTVYDHVHIGNLRAYLVPDLLHRLFLRNGYTVKLTVNVTDFGHLTDDGDAGEDKIMKGMKREGYEITLENMRTFTETYIRSFAADLAAFGNLPPTNVTRASDYVAAQIKIVETLVQKGYAYETSDGVYFDVSRFPAYGVLGNVDVSALRSGARVEENPEKRHPADFALWKKGELGWKSRFGTGFPGWHIECTAMVFGTLGKQIDIHTGGEDLMYTHHNGEIAQAEAITGKEYVKYWVHNAFVTAGDDKMAKSRGTGTRLAELRTHGFTPADYRYWLLMTHYRSPITFSPEALTAARQALLRLRRFVYEECANIRASYPAEAYEKKFIAALSDDLDTPKALAHLWELMKDERVTRESKLATIHAFDALLSLGLGKAVAVGQAELGHVKETEIPEAIQELVAKREEARAQKDWELADSLRAELKTKGFLVEDAPEGPKLTHV